ncbi:cobyric acid synthase CobQ, partial [Vibrio sp. Vb0937]|nr:cobyric acid synthase CobQ [Vibrio sp. Vb0937]
GQIMGTCLHGFFDEAEALNLITEWVNGTQVKQQDFEVLKEQGINRIADAIEQHMNLDFLFK